MRSSAGVTLAAAARNGRSPCVVTHGGRLLCAASVSEGPDSGARIVQVFSEVRLEQLGQRVPIAQSLAAAVERVATHLGRVAWRPAIDHRGRSRHGGHEGDQVVAAEPLLAVLEMGGAVAVRVAGVTDASSSKGVNDLCEQCDQMVWP